MGEPKILAVCGTYDRGGIEMMLLNLARHGLAMDLCAVIPDEGTLEDAFHAAGCRTFKLTRRSDNIVKHHRELYRIIKDGKYDVVWLNSQNAFYMRLHMAVARAAGAKVIAVHSHNTKDWRGERDNRLSRLNGHYLYKHADIRLACGTDAAKWLFGTDKGVTVIPLPVDTETLKVTDAKRKEARKKLKISDGTTVFLQAGRFDPVKNQRFTTDIFRWIHDADPDSLLIFAGDGQTRRDVEKDVYETESIADAVYFPGVVEDMSTLYAASDVLLMPSLYEGFPTVLLEAQAAGLRCIASDAVDRDVNITGAVRFLPACLTDQGRWVAAAGEAERPLSEQKRLWMNAVTAKEYDVNAVADKLKSLFAGAVSAKMSL